MGSQSDFKTMKLCQNVLEKLGIKFETKIISAHRTPDRMFDYAKKAERNNITLIIAGAGGSAHLPDMISALTSLPVLGVPIESKKLKGLDSLLSIVQMPKGIPVGTLAIGKDGAINEDDKSILFVYIGAVGDFVYISNEFRDLIDEDIESIEIEDLEVKISHIDGTLIEVDYGWNGINYYGFIDPKG